MILRTRHARSACTTASMPDKRTESTHLGGLIRGEAPDHGKKPRAEQKYSVRHVYPTDRSSLYSSARESGLRLLVTSLARVTGLEWSTRTLRRRETSRLNSTFSWFAILTLGLDCCRQDCGNSLVAYFPSIRRLPPRAPPSIPRTRDTTPWCEHSRCFKVSANEITVRKRQVAEPGCGTESLNAISSLRGNCRKVPCT